MFFLIKETNSNQELSNFTLTNSYYVYFPTSKFLFCGDTFIDYTTQKYTISFFMQAYAGN